MPHQSAAEQEQEEKRGHVDSQQENDFFEKLLRNEEKHKDEIAEACHSLIQSIESSYSKKSLNLPSAMIYKAIQAHDIDTMHLFFLACLKSWPAFRHYCIEHSGFHIHYLIQWLELNFDNFLRNAKFGAVAALESHETYLNFVWTARSIYLMHQGAQLTPTTSQ